MAGSATGTGSIFEFNGHYYEAVRVDVWDSTQNPAGGDHAAISSLASQSNYQLQAQ